MYKKVQKILSLIGIFGTSVFVLSAVSNNDGELSAQSLGSKTVLPGINVEVDLGDISTEVTFEVEEAKNVGNVVWVRTNKNVISPCYLGAYYILDKETFSKISLEDVSERMKNAVESENYLQPHAKEFDGSFLIFEPNKKACPGSLFEVKNEMNIRESLWISVPSATFI